MKLRGLWETWIVPTDNAQMWHHMFFRPVLREQTQIFSSSLESKSIFVFYTSLVYLTATEFTPHGANHSFQLAAEQHEIAQPLVMMFLRNPSLSDILQRYFDFPAIATLSLEKASL